MKTKAVRLYGKDDLRLEEFDLPAIREDEILAKVVSDSICMSSYKATKQGADHKRVPDNVAENPVIIGHEFCGELIEVGSKWSNKFKKGQKFAIQPALGYKGSLDAPGYSYRYIGGDATYVILPSEVMEVNCLLDYSGSCYFTGSLAEPMSCIIGAFHAQYHSKYGVYKHEMDIKSGGKMAILAGVGPMGLGAIDYALHREIKPSLLVVTDIDEQRLKRAQSIYSPEEARKVGIELIYVNTGQSSAGTEELKAVSGGTGFDDVFVFAPVKPVVEMADKILAYDGCLNFFAGPSDPNFHADFNFYNVHYAQTHIVGTSGGNTDDMREALELMSEGKINPAVMITHVGGLDAVAETTKNLPHIPGGKKLIYTHISLPLAAIDDFEKLGKENPLFAELHRIVAKTKGIWSEEAEEYLLKNGKKI
jgi:threonine dehydrogenase-like Zn-dependent dehydrogenase